MPRQWYPDFLIDEVLPESRWTAAAWLPYLLGETPDEDGLDIRKPFLPGDEVSFCWFEHRGMTVFRIKADGTLAVPLRCTETPDMFGGQALSAPDVVTADINTFWNDEHELWAATPEEFARDYARGDMLDPGDADDIEVSIGVWSDKITFTISPDGKSLIPATSPETSNVQG